MGIILLAYFRKASMDVVCQSNEKLMQLGLINKYVDIHTNKDRTQISKWIGNKAIQKAIKH